MGEPLIRDIRYFESVCGCAPGFCMPDHLGKVFPLENRSEAVALGARFALKLAERGFRTRIYHHVYIQLTPALPAETVRISDVQLEPWMVIVEVGQPIDEWPTSGEEAQSRQLVRLTGQVLRFLCDAHQLDGRMIPHVEAQILEHGAELEIERKVKETRSYRAVVSYQVLPYGQPTPLYVEYQDHKTGARGKKEVLRLKDFEDVFPLVGSVSVVGGILRLLPRNSFRARAAARGYQTPIEVPVTDLLMNEALSIA